jgi:exodeoxyribonuclease VII large subunit
VSPTARLGAHAQRLDELEQSLVRALRRRLQERRERLRWLMGRAALLSPSTRLTQQRLLLESLVARLYRAGQHALDSRRERLLPLVRTLNAVSPLATLERGYAIVSLEGGDILRNAADAKPGTVIEARLAHGRLRARVEGAP